jgi:hypothetical protein
VNFLHENVPEEQRRLLLRGKIAVRQIGNEVGAAGMTDENILPLLHHLRRPTFFTRDADFYRRGLRHERYCLVWLDVRPADVAEHVRKFLRHPAFKAQAKRMGWVAHVAPSGISAWGPGAEKESHWPWPTKGRK